MLFLVPFLVRKYHTTLRARRSGSSQTEMWLAVAHPSKSSLKATAIRRTAAS